MGRNFKNSADQPLFLRLLGITSHYLEDNTAQMLIDWIERPEPAELAAFGEIGLDYYRNLSPRKNKITFAQLAEYGKTLNLPLIIHCRKPTKIPTAIIRNIREKSEEWCIVFPESLLGDNLFNWVSIGDYRPAYYRKVSS